MLDAKTRCERDGKPAFRDSRRQSLAVRWVGERDVERAGVELRDEANGIGAMDAQRVPCTKRLRVLLDRAHAGNADLHAVGGRRPARQRFQA